MSRDVTTPRGADTTFNRLFRPARFGRTNLANADAALPTLMCHGTAYEGWPSLIAGPTGSGKSLICRWLLLEVLRDGKSVGHADQEMGAAATKQYYKMMGATPDELEQVNYWDMPSPTDSLADEWVAEVDALADVLLMDKVPDFLRSANKAENSNDDVNSWFAAFVEPLRGLVTTLIIDATGWDKSRTRGGSEKEFKVGLSWVVETIDEPRSDHIGRVRWRCTKDRFGAVGRGTTIEFAVGGDGAGHISCAVASVSSGETAAVDDAEKRRLDRLNAWKATAVLAAKKHAPDEVHAIPKTTLEQLMGGGKAADKREGIQAAIGDMDPHNERLGSKPKTSGNGIVVWWKPAGSS
jgi:hypothetical protein